jgi:hypothetical protein
LEHLPRRYPGLYEREGSLLTVKPLDMTVDVDQTELHPLDLAGKREERRERGQCKREGREKREE